jgi:hypothetical protein
LKLDPCLRIKNTSSGAVLMATYVEECLAIGTDKAIEEVIKPLKGYGFGL